jgi:hypothetical protein
MSQVTHAKIWLDGCIFPNLPSAQHHQRSNQGLVKGDPCVLRQAARDCSGRVCTAVTSLADWRRFRVDALVRQLVFLPLNQSGLIPSSFELDGTMATPPPIEDEARLPREAAAWSGLPGRSVPVSLGSKETTEKSTSPRLSSEPHKSPSNRGRSGDAARFRIPLVVLAILSAALWSWAGGLTSLGDVAGRILDAGSTRSISTRVGRILRRTPLFGMPH